MLSLNRGLQSCIMRVMDGTCQVTSMARRLFGVYCIGRHSDENTYYRTMCHGTIERSVGYKIIRSIP